MRRSPSSSARSEVVFTSGATESIATACLGVGDRGKQVVPVIEHSACGESAARAGAVATIGVDEVGRVDPGALLDAIAPDTALVHLQWSNHEVGTVQPVASGVGLSRPGYWCTSMLRKPSGRCRSTSGPWAQI